MSTAIITAEIKEGATLEQVAWDMCDLASQCMCNVKFVYEGIEMIINEDQTDVDIVKEWRRRKDYQERYPAIDVVSTRYK